MTCDHERDSNFMCFIEFYSRSYEDNQYEQKVRADIVNVKKRAKRKEAEAMVNGYRAFDTVRQGIMFEFKHAAQKTPSCAILPLLETIEKSMTCTFETLREEYTCSITRQRHTMGLRMTLTPDPEDPFGPAAVSYPMRSDFKEVMQAYRIMARFRYMTMKIVSDYEGVYHEDKEAVQKLYDSYMRAQKILLHVASQESTI